MSRKTELTLLGFILLGIGLALTLTGKNVLGLPLQIGAAVVFLAAIGQKK